MEIAQRFLLVLVIACAGGHMLLTGSPLPLWHIESLENPQAVAAITDDAILLKNGGHITLPYIATLPPTIPSFAKRSNRALTSPLTVKSLDYFASRTFAATIPLFTE